MNWDPQKPYNDLPPLPPTADVESREILKETIEARASLASLDQAVQRIPNPSILINSLSILEAQASSEIENIVTTSDDLFRNVQREAESASPETKETLRYRTALFAGLESIRSRPLSTNTAVQICTIIHDREMAIRRTAGTMIADQRTRTAVYTPPTGEQTIRDLLSNWERFIHASDELDPLIAMAIGHYQFEAIHPFGDGNGRTGRILNVLHLVHAGLLEVPVLYLSRYIIEHKDDYYRLLLQVTTEGAWEEWILFMLRGLRETARSTLRKIDGIEETQRSVMQSIRDVTTAGPNADLLDVLFENVYCRISDVVARCEVSRPTATGWLNALVENGTLVDHKIGRERLFLNVAFAEVLGRPEL